MNPSLPSGGSTEQYQVLVVDEGRELQARRVVLRCATLHTMPPETNSKDFGVFWNELADSNSIFVVAKFFFENFWCVQSSTTHSLAVHVHVLWPVCTHTIPFRMLWRP